MEIFGWTWHYGLPGLLVMAGIGAVWSAIRTDARRLPRPGSYWPWSLLLIVWTGDAVLGEGRPPFERMAKGVIAGLLWTSLAIVVWRRRRHRATVAPATSTAQPDRTAGEGASAAVPDEDGRTHVVP